MSLGAMQPYLFPYLGYFQLMDCVDTYLFCGNVQYIKQGWVNRNRICVNSRERNISYFSFSIKKDDYRKHISQRYYSNLKNDCEKLKRNIYQAYRKATNFEEAYCVIERALQYKNENVAYFNMNANFEIAKYLGIHTNIGCIDTITDDYFWQQFYTLKYEERMIFVCKYFQENRYVNAIGGKELYHKDFFRQNGIDLQFIQMDEVKYPQLCGDFVEGLSIIDVIMNNDISNTKRLLKSYTLV